ncbi:MAG: hypothetical protein CSA22_02550 [Deltaproteobacteria bacterium]|nr:MAG: hypothetical protein CSA22_02550 [Deltaproteobacteria bacterium]
MKTPKWLHLVILAFFLFQTLMPVPAMAAKKSTEKIVPIPGGYAVDSADFMDGIASLDRDLIRSYLAYMGKSATIRAGMRKRSEEFSELLKAGAPLVRVQIADPTYASLANEAERSLAYVTDALSRTEQDHNKKTESLEKTVRAGFSGSRLPDGLLGKTRLLEDLYRQQDTLVQMKLNMAAKLTGIYDNIRVNGKVFPQPEAVKTWLAAVDGLMIALEAQTLVLKQETEAFEAEKRTYNEAALAALSLERERTLALKAENDRQIDYLTSVGTPYTRDQAALLSGVQDVLDYRLNEIEARERAVEQDVSGTGNFLYLPESLDAVAAIRPLVNRYRNIASGWIELTGARIGDADHLIRALDDAIAAMTDESSQLSAWLSTASGVYSPEGTAALKQGLETRYDGFLNILIANRDALKKARNDLSSISFSDPDALTRDAAATARIVRFNQLVEAAIGGLDGISVTSFVMDVRTTADLESLATAIGPGSLESVFNASEQRARAISQVADLLEALETGLTADRDQSALLRMLALDLVSEGKRIYQQKSRAVSRALTHAPSGSGKVYRSFLEGTQLHLSGRYEELKAYDAAIPAGFSSRLTEAACPLCLDTRVWNDTAQIGTLFQERFEELAKLEQLDPLLSAAYLTETDPYRVAEHLFALSLAVDSPPLMTLKEDSIDVTFVIGDKATAILNVGKTNSVSASRLIPETDPWIQGPYIGWSFNPKTAWGSEKKRVADTGAMIISARKGFANTASEILEGAKVIGGKITTRLSEYRKKAGEVIEKTGAGLVKAKNALWDTTQKAAAVSWDVIKNIGTQAFLDEHVDAHGNKTYSVGWMKLVGYGLGGAACVVTGGLACIPLAVSAGAAGLKGVFDTMAMKKYNIISENTQWYLNTAVDIADLIGSGILNIKSAGKAWQGMSKMHKALVFLGLDPDNVKHLGELFSVKAYKGLKTIWKYVAEGRFSAIRSVLEKFRIPVKMAERFLNGLNAGKTLYDAYMMVTGLPAKLADYYTYVISPAGSLLMNGVKKLASLDPMTLLKYGLFLGPGWSPLTNGTPLNWSMTPQDALDALGRAIGWAYTSGDAAVKWIADLVMVHEALALNPMSPAAQSYLESLIAAFISRSTLDTLSGLPDTVFSGLSAADDYIDLLSRYGEFMLAAPWAIADDYAGGDVVHSETGTRLTGGSATDTGTAAKTATPPKHRAPTTYRKPVPVKPGKMRKLPW